MKFNLRINPSRKNRALAGAIKESRTIGSDNKEYGRTEHEYTLHEITPSGAPPTPKGYVAKSFLIEPTAVRTYMKGTLVQTKAQSIELEPNEYEMKVIDFFDEALLHPRP